MCSEQVATAGSYLAIGIPDAHLPLVRHIAKAARTLEVILQVLPLLPQHAPGRVHAPPGGDVPCAPPPCAPPEETPAPAPNGVPAPPPRGGKPRPPADPSW